MLLPNANQGVQASEDIGLANPEALPQAVAAYQATQLLGMPECGVRSLPPSLPRGPDLTYLQCILGQVAVLLAESPKSVRTYNAYNAVTALVASGENHPVSPPRHQRERATTNDPSTQVPIHLRNAPTGLMKKLGVRPVARSSSRSSLTPLDLSTDATTSTPPPPLPATLPTSPHRRYNPSFAHPVTQPFLPPELVGTHFLQPDDSVKGKLYDEAALREWEWKNQGGRAWEGREEMLEKLAKEEET